MVLSSIHELSLITIHLPKDLTKTKNKDIILVTLRAIVDKFKGKVPLLHPVKDMKIDNDRLDEYIARKDFLMKESREIESGLNLKN